MREQLTDNIRLTEYENNRLKTSKIPSNQARASQTSQRGEK